MFIYVHLPFCRSKCIYCDFVVVVSQDDALRKRYLDALVLEIETAFALGEGAADRDVLEPIQTIYFGGGTPGLFSAEDITRLLRVLTRYAPLAPDAEITFEVNPDGATSPLDAYRAVGINRLSIGVQSLQANELKRLSRIHSPAKAIALVETAHQAGFDNISIDLMYGIPEQTMASWEATLREAISLPIQHVSMYGLQVETETKLEMLIKTGRLSVADGDANADLYDAAVAMLASVGLQRYEISNFAKDGAYSRHNMNYWRQGDYWAFGVGAHGFVARHRYENTDDLAAYCAQPGVRGVTQTASVVSDDEQCENKIIFGLRLTEGVALAALTSTERVCFEQRILPRLARYLETGVLAQSDTHLRLSPDFFTSSNEVMQAVLLND